MESRFPSLCSTTILRLQRSQYQAHGNPKLCICIVYPLFLIFLTWICIDFYGRGFKPIVYIVVTFHKCLAKLKQDWGDKRDVVDVLSAFFLLSYSRLMYQSSLFLVCDKVSDIHGKHGHWGIRYIMNYDSNIMCGSSKYIAIAVVSLLIIFVFSILPPIYTTSSISFQDCSMLPI